MVEDNSKDVEMLRQLTKIAFKVSRDYYYTTEPQSTITDHISEV